MAGASPATFRERWQVFQPDRNRPDAWKYALPPNCTLDTDVKRIERVARRHEQAVALDAAKADVGAALRKRNRADPLAFRVEHHDPVEPFAGAPAAPQIAVCIATKAVRRLGGLAGHEHLAIGELGTVVDDIVDPDQARHIAEVDDIHFPLVRREAQPVRPDVADHHGGAAGLRIEPVDVGRQLLLRHVALVVAGDAWRRIREPDRAVGFDYDVVRGIERLPVELVYQHRDGAVIFGTRHAPGVVLAGDEAALAVARVAVGVVRRLAVHGGAARLLIPPQDAIVRNVAPQQAARVAEPHRPFAPAGAGVEALDAGVENAIFQKARIDDLDGRVRITLARFPAAKCLRRGQRSRGHRRPRAQNIPS